MTRAVELPDAVRDELSADEITEIQDEALEDAAPAIELIVSSIAPTLEGKLQREARSSRAAHLGRLGAANPQRQL